MKKLILRMILRSFEIEDELISNPCECSVCQLLRKVLGLLKIEA